MTTDTIRKATEKVAPEPCIHCSGSRYVLEEVETTFGEFEDVSYLCPGCCGTGQKMDKAERTRIKAGL